MGGAPGGGGGGCHTFGKGPFRLMWITGGCPCSPGTPGDSWAPMTLDRETECYFVFWSRSIKMLLQHTGPCAARMQM